MANEMRSIYPYLPILVPGPQKFARTTWLTRNALAARNTWVRGTIARQYPNYETGVDSCEACRSFNKTFLYLFLQVSSEFYDTTKFQVKAVLELTDSNCERPAAFRHSTKWVNKIYNTISSRKAMIMIVEC